jgi:hypothetical protein
VLTLSFFGVIMIGILLEILSFFNDWLLSTARDESHHAFTICYVPNGRGYESPLRRLEAARLQEKGWWERYDGRLSRTVLR